MLAVLIPCTWTAPPGTELTGLPLECGRAWQARHIGMFCSPFSAQKGRRFPLKPALKLWPDDCPPPPPHQRFPPRLPFRLIFPSSYNFPLTPPESGKTGPGAEINAQVACKSGCSNPLSWCQQPPAKRRRLPGPNKEAGSSYPGIPREWSSWSSHSSSYRSGRLSGLQRFHNTLN